MKHGSEVKVTPPFEHHIEILQQCLEFFLVIDLMDRTLLGFDVLLIKTEVFWTIIYIYAID